MPLVILRADFRKRAAQLIGCLLPHCRALTHSELAPLRASLVPMEHCITRFFEECDPNKDKHITLKEWGHCFGIKEGKFITGPGRGRPVLQTPSAPRPPWASCCAQVKPTHGEAAALPRWLPRCPAVLRGYFSLPQWYSVFRGWEVWLVRVYLQFSLSSWLSRRKRREYREPCQISEGHPCEEEGVSLCPCLAGYWTKLLRITYEHE